MHTKTHMWGRRCERGVRALRACAHGASICVPSGVIPDASSHGRRERSLEAQLLQENTAPIWNSERRGSSVVKPNNRILSIYMMIDVHTCTCHAHDMMCIHDT